MQHQIICRISQWCQVLLLSSDRGNAVPIFKQVEGTLTLIQQVEFDKERELQKLIEQNLEEVFGCRVVKSEFSTGAEHAGRIDTLALSEENNPVIIEYKKIESDSLIAQALFYLSWLRDHRGDYQEAVRNSLGTDISVDWSSVRVICVAPSYSKFALHSVKMMSPNADLELWQYNTYENGLFELEEVYRTNQTTATRTGQAAKEPLDAEITTEDYSLESHSETLATEELKQAFQDVHDFAVNLNGSVNAVPKSKYVAYKLARNFACIETQRQKILITLSLSPEKVGVPLPDGFRDVSNVGHYGTGDLEFRIQSSADVEEAKRVIRLAYLAAGGD